ncbi:MAG: hypothetical protein F4Y00_09025 [Bacteroidetes bacterium SB0662_bin_6]|nr:hypothetical protein [Bacteroidetes bacterium SB0668_bin_1]MYE05095.1 hypothetical protein [Bacteroidetes bacterium SB0662_bin_6]
MKRKKVSKAGRGWYTGWLLHVHRVLWGALMVTVVTHAPARAQGEDRRDGPAYVHIDTNFPEALVFADSLLVGGASAMLLAVPAASRSIRLTAPNPDAWSIAPIARPLDVAPGDTARVVMRFPYHYRIESEPFGADVLIQHLDQGRSIGVTPLLYRSEDPLEGSILVRRIGYISQSIQPGKAVWNRHVVHLEPISELDTATQMNLNPPRPHRAWIDYAALGTALAAGAFAVHYKFKADDLADEYERTRDEALTPRIETHDFRAAVAFGVMQGGVAVFALRLVLR